MKKTYPYSLNIIIATLSLFIAVAYIYFTAAQFIDHLKCATCGDVTMAFFKHYWYRWCLYGILIFASFRLYLKLLGARRLYYLFFAGAIIIAVLDGLSGFYEMRPYDIALDVIIPIIASIIGVAYFKSIYKATLKYR